MVVHVEGITGSGDTERAADEDDYDRRPQRRRYEEPLPVKVRKQLLAVAESPLHKVEDDISNIAKTVAENADQAEVKSSFIDLVIQVIIEQPLKIPFVAGIILQLNTQKPEIVAEILDRAGQAVQAYMEIGSWKELKLVLRFLGCLQGLFEGEGIFATMEELFSRAVELQTSSSEDSLGLEIVKVILLTIPYVMSSSAKGFESHAEALLEKTDIIASIPHALEPLVDPYPGDGENTKEPQSVISLLQKQLQHESAQDWELACLPRVWKPQEDTAEDQLASATKHSFPTINVPNPVVPGPRAIFPEIYISVYLDQEVETVPPVTDIASSLIRDSLVDTIDILDYNRNVTAKFLIDIDCYFSSNVFVKRATPFDKLRDVSDDRSTWKPEDVAVDAVFSELFKLPNPEHKLVYYHSVLTEACKIAPAAIAPSLGRAIRYLYKNIDMMDLELNFRFLDWFAHHLSNFGFTWKWTEWTEDIKLPNLHPKKAFMIGALDKEVRLSFAQRIRGTLPEEYHPLITEDMEKDQPDFKYDDDSTPYSAQTREICTLVRKKSSDSAITPLLTEIASLATSHGISDPLVPSTDAYVTSICNVGSKSLSHVLSCIERCKDRLLAIGPQSEGARKQIIQSVMEYWKDVNPGTGVNIVDKLLNYTILTPRSVIEWALVDYVDGGRSLSKSYVFEMVSATVGKVTGRVRQIVMARNRIGLPPSQVVMLEETLKRERDEMRDLIKSIEDAVGSVENGLLPSQALAEGELDDEDVRLVRWWGTKWGSVFKRKGSVEEAWLIEREEERKRAEVRLKEEANDGILGLGGDEKMDNGPKIQDIE
ncbi:MAG: hypothetical protein M1834_000266 [Cirrosporium novae-zelandiae]|nr:MAG: hypothetical protein M1834_000266 [Cirrosporium novae-zelandiae]